MTTLTPAPTVRLYTQPGCGPCAAVKRFFEKKGLAPTILDVTKDTEAADHLRQLQIKSTPVVEVGSERILGFDDKKITEALAALN